MAAVGRTAGQAPEVDGVTYIEGRLPEGTAVGDIVDGDGDAPRWGTTWWGRAMRPNLPNSISLFRILMIPLFMVFLLGDIPAGDIVALVVFVIAVGQRLPRRLPRPPLASDDRLGRVPRSAGRQAAGHRGAGVPRAARHW